MFPIGAVSAKTCHARVMGRQRCSRYAAILVSGNVSASYSSATSGQIVSGEA
jgi:hypothetical protein